MEEPFVKIFITGGTIDDIDYDSEKVVPLSKYSSIPHLLKQSRVALAFETEILFQKDSRFITDEDRELIVDKCRDCESDKILITHGSYTMSITAQTLGNAKLGKTIVLFGSIVPANNQESDALFNLGGAFTAVQILPKGVYIISNGKIFNWDNVKKNPKTAYFEKEYE